jgi:thiamine biosynthesis lipoprotein
MGTSCSISVFGDGDVVEAVADLGVRRVRMLEERWSRFQDTSELSRLNARAGEGLVTVSPDTIRLVRVMCRGFEMTNGAFDPSMLQAIREYGYDRDFQEVVASDFVEAASSFAPLESNSSMADVTITDHQIALPTGMGIDPGAIGKGLAADIVVEELRSAGVAGVLVDLGGDIALSGTPGEDPSWCIDVRDERSPEAVSEFRRVVLPVGIDHAGVATSTTKTRRWAEARHHVLDPATDRSTNERVVQATVAGPRAWECEVWATACVVRPANTMGKLSEDFSALVVSASGLVRDDLSGRSPLVEVA